MVLFIVIGVVLVVGILAVVILRIITSHARLTHHQVTRVQAMYAAKAGMLYALDKLRRNDDPTCWPTGPGQYTRSMNREGSGACEVREPDLPPAVSEVLITVYDLGTSYGPADPLSRKVSATANFLYTSD